jgi:hypothetical protein
VAVAWSVPETLTTAHRKSQIHPTPSPRLPLLDRVAQDNLKRRFRAKALRSRDIPG